MLDGAQTVETIAQTGQKVSVKKPWLSQITGAFMEPTNFVRACSLEDIKPIVGAELYVRSLSIL